MLFGNMKYRQLETPYIHHPPSSGHLILSPLEWNSSSRHQFIDSLYERVYKSIVVFGEEDLQSKFIKTKRFCIFSNNLSFIEKFFSYLKYPNLSEVELIE